MLVEQKRDRGQLQVNQDECKGCGLCVAACPPRAIELSERINRYGYRTATYVGRGCTGCGICFLACPEPGAITVLQAVKRPAGPGRRIASSIAGVDSCASN
jgi:Pyruvate/2-oxoacid:ferredoxin oxidoreductase delta subunit